MANTARLIKALTGPDPWGRRLACEEISGLRKGDDFIPYLAVALGDLDHGVSEAAMNALVEIGGTAVVAAVTPLLRDREARLRNRAIEILISSGEGATAPVSELLTDSDDDVVKFAVDILCEIKDPASVAGVAKLLEHPNANVRGAAVLYMGRARPYGAATYITTALDDKEQWVRFSAVEALGLLGDTRYIDPLLEILRVERGLVREAAVDALSNMVTTANSYEILMAMKDFLSEDLAVPVSSIVEILEKASGASWDIGSFASLRETLFKALEKAFGETEVETEKIALRGFVLLGDRRGIHRAMDFMNSMEELDEETEEYVINILVELCSGDKVPDDLLECIADDGQNAIVPIKVAGRLRAVEALPALAKCLEGATKEKARAILVSVDEIGSADSKVLLHKSIYSHDGHVRKMAARTLVRIAGEDVAEDLFAMMLRERYRDVIEAVTETIAGLGTDKVRAGFMNLVSNSREDMREMACMGLGRMGGKASVAPLVEATEDKDPQVRKMAYISLAMLGVREATGPVIKGLGLGNEEISIAILEALNTVTTDDLKAAVRECLTDSNLWVRHHAVTLLGEMLDMDSEEAIIEILEKDAPPVKAAAVRALAGFSSEKALPVLKSLYEGSDPSLRSAIIKAIEEIQC